MIPKILVQGEIKKGFADKFRAVLAKYPHAKIEIYVDSNGGLAAEGLAAAANIKAFRRAGGVVDVVVIKADSAASFIAAAATNRLIVADGVMLLHGVSSAGRMPEDQRLNAAFNKRLVALYSERALLPNSIMAIINSGHDYEFDAHAAVANGLADLVKTTPLRNEAYHHVIN